MRRAGSNTAGALSQEFLVAIDLVDQIANASSLAAYTDAEKAEIANAAVVFFDAIPGLKPTATHDTMLPYVESALSCFNIYARHIPIGASAGPSGGCAVASESDACSSVGGTWTAGACVPPPAPAPAPAPGPVLNKPIPSPAPAPAPSPPDQAAACAKAGGTWDGTICSKSGVSTSGGLLTGALIVAVPVALVLITMNMKKRK